MDTSQKSVPVRPQRMFVYDVLKAIFLSWHIFTIMINTTLIDTEKAVQSIRVQFTPIYSLFHSLHYNAYDIGGIKLQVS